ncbi:MAG: hypothetical protein HYT77_03150 [Deltaproteobacteria bacterium]|nr:hypothetical protein [Deltaproteobacteria bacterium]
MRKIYLTLFALLLMTGQLFAGLDDLDTSFGPAGTGIVTLDLDVADASDKTVINDVEIQADGKIVVAGYHLQGTDNDIVLARFNADGTIDSSFGADGNGVVITDLGTDQDIGYALSLGSSGGKIVVAGEKDGNFAVLRYNTNGTLDTSFDTDGIVTTDFGGADTARDVVAIFGGGIVAVGYSVGSGAATDFALAKYTSSGALDPAFDGASSGNGKFKTDFGSSDKAYAFAFVGSRLIVAGQSANNFALAKYNATTGALDTTFDGDGKLTTDFGGSDAAYAIKTVGTTSLIVAGKGGNDFAMAKYLNSNGALDTTFSGDGKLTTDIGASSVDYANDLVIDNSTSTILVAGKAGGDFGIARYDFSGTLDPAFDSDGKLTLNLGGDQDIPTSIELLSNGRFLVGGKKGVGGSVGEMALVQYGSYSADASVSLTASADSILVGSEVTYTIGLSNNGLDTMTVYGLDADFDSSFEFVSVAITQGTCEFYEGDNELNCGGIGPLAGGGFVEVTLVLKATVAGSLNGWAGVSASPDNNSSNDSITLIVTAFATEEELPPRCGDDQCGGDESCSSCEAPLSIFLVERPPALLALNRMSRLVRRAVRAVARCWETSRPDQPTFC